MKSHGLEETFAAPPMGVLLLITDVVYFLGRCHWLEEIGWGVETSFKMRNDR